MTVRYENESYRVEEEVGVVTLALVLEGEAVYPVTVSVNTLNLTNSSVGDAATGELGTLAGKPCLLQVGLIADEQSWQNAQRKPLNAAKNTAQPKNTGRCQEYATHILWLSSII